MKTKTSEQNSQKKDFIKRSTQIHRETNTPTIKDFITTPTLNFHSRLPLATGALFYNIGLTSIHPRLKPRLSQDMNINL
jgi:hypothetical protein